MTTRHFIENDLSHDPLAETSQPTEFRTPYPASAFRGPLFETRDTIALILATVMLLGPLAMMPLGLAG